MRFLYFALCAVLVATSATASPPSQVNAERLLILMQTERLHKERFEALDKLNRRGFAERFGEEKSLTVEQRQTVETAVATASQIVRTELSWPRIKPDLIRIIQETFNDEELSTILDSHANQESNVLSLPVVEEKFARYLLDQFDAAGSMVQAGIDRKLRELRVAQLNTTSDPLSHLKEDWVITTFLFGGGHSGISACGLAHQPASIQLHSDGIIEISATCKDGSQYYLRLVRGNDQKTWLFTVKNKEGISINDFPLNYYGSKGWMGSAQQLVDDKEISLSAYIAPIEGRTWYGWATWVRPTAEAGVDYTKSKTPYLKVDFIRRK